MDYRLWMTEALAKLTEPAKPSFPDNRAGKRAKTRSERNRGKGFTK
jgi:hypothetical protein